MERKGDRADNSNGMGMKDHIPKKVPFNNVIVAFLILKMYVGKDAEGRQLSDARIYDWEFSHNIFCANCEAKYIIYNC